MRTTSFEIDGMNCESCASAIRSLLEKEPGVRAASVSLRERRACVLHDPASVQVDRLIDLIQKRGFRVVAQEAAGQGAS